MTRHWLLAAAVALALGGCALNQRANAPAPAPAVHYVLGQPYQNAAGWHYPREQFDYDANGLATVTVRRSGPTADGEIADPHAMAGAHATLQLPAVAKITNLDTGLQVLVRINDRGPEQRGRLIALTPRVFELLGAGGQATFRVRVQVQEGESRRLVADLSTTDQPAIKVAAAPAGVVKMEALALPPGVKQSTLGRTGPVMPHAAGKAVVSAEPVPLHLPEIRTRVSAHPGSLYVETGTFGQLQFAELMRRRLASLGAQTSTSYDAPRESAYRVRIGPLFSVPVADAMLERAVRMGASDARIVAE